MDSSAQEKKPAFFWQATLILLPVALLAAVGLLSLRQDRALAQQEATERASAVAEELVPKLWSELAAATNRLLLPRHAFQIDDAGRLLFPPPAAEVPAPMPLSPASLAPEQCRRWEAAQCAEAQERAPAVTLGAWRDFLSSNPPAAFAAAARYALGVWLARAGDSRGAAQEFGAVVESYPDAVGESGLPLLPLAQLKLLELEAGSNSLSRAKPPADLEVLCSNAVLKPTLLTPQLLTLAGQRAVSAEARKILQKWQAVWESDQLSRQLFAATSSRFHRATGPALSLRLLESQVLASGESETPAAGTSPDTALPDVFWFSTPSAWRHVVTNQPDGLVFTLDDRNWLALRSEEQGTNHWIVCLAESEVGELATTLVNATRQIPDYCGIGIELAGKRLAWFAPDLRVWQVVHYVGGKGAGQDKKAFLNQPATEVLASATKSSGGRTLLKVEVFLTSPATLFQRQRARSFWFGSLIATSAFAALMGLLAAYRSFHRQLRLSELKSNFVSSVSHELRAPIASVRLMAESLERGKILEASKQREYFRFIVQECRRLSSLIENVLDFSRIEQGRKEYEFEPTDLVALVTQTVGLMQTYADERHVNLALSLEGYPSATDNHSPSLDGKAIQQALINLIDNALKHSPKGDTVAIGLEFSGSIPEAQPPPTGARHPVSGIRLWVEDHGPGIPPGEQQRIFERFYRLGSELRRETPGVGIGLSIVKHIVEAHGGRVLVRSDVGQGSRFTIELPMTPEGTKSERRNPKAE